ncbi:DUF6716 putative glycosyltransferase [Pseudovibrio brasiliensis]|uniref:Capsule polysaccharide biosynthesis protein n=1 Tax=Pseudovibrio brasiliensis TaxID=1898042 RepID=A0ABX8AII9_9HYPH|nr:DUF6716 putative glycosyltransferase [Pseudovibrio brasiliensis]QUS54888.1 hypothetical protein KGB56_16130 [Pseudovibrio brasiliensis]
MRILLIVDSDSQVFGMLPYAEICSAAEYKCTFLIPVKNNIPHHLMSQLKNKYEVLNANPHDCTINYYNFEAIGVSLPGSKISEFRNFMQNLCEKNLNRPFIFTIFNGLVYEKFEEGLAWRLGYDLICLNSMIDFQKAKTLLANTPYKNQPFLVTGLSRSEKTAVKNNHSSEKKVFLFVEQVAAPKTKNERDWLFQSLNQLAKNNLDWEFIIKPRIRKTEKTFHNCVLHAEDALKNTAFNLQLSHQPLTELIASADIIVSVSSTALFDAHYAGKPIAYVADFGWRNDLGTHVFAGSGIDIHIANHPALNEFIERRPNPKWLEDIGARSYELNNLPDLIEAYCISPSPLPLTMYDQRFLSVHKNIKKHRRSRLKETFRYISDYCNFFKKP